MKPVLAFTLGVDHPSSRLRIASYRDRLAERGWQLELFHFFSGIGSAPEHPRSLWKRVPWRLAQAWRLARVLVRLARLPPDQPILISRESPVGVWPFLLVGNPLVLDLDDALYLGPGREPILRFCRRARAVVCGNNVLAAELSSHAPRCEVIPTVVDARVYRVRTDYRKDGPLRLGWIGSSMSIEVTLLPWLDTLRALRGKLDFELVTILDDLPESLRQTPWIRHLTWSPEVEASLAEHIDVGLMPLQDDPFQAAKCGAKLLQYMAAGLPTIATPLGVNAEIVEHGVTGFHARTADDWHKAIAALAESAELRASLGQAGRRRVEQGYCVGVWAPVWVGLLESLVR